MSSRVRLLLLVVLLLVAAGCAAPAPTAAPTQLSKPAATSAPATGGPAAAQLAEAAQPLFTKTCGPCHGAKGEGITGPAIIGTASQLGKYGSAQGLLEKISTTMPRNKPASLSAEQYQQLLAFLLLQNQFVKADTALEASQLAAIPLSK